MYNYGKMRGDLEDMGMLKSITLKNYKCFRDETTIDIAPLTVLCGVNSSGKSSILKSLLMLKQSYESEHTTQAIAFNGKWVDNGFFNDTVYHNKTITKDNENEFDHFFISNKFIIKPYDKKIKTQDASSFRELRKMFYRISDIAQFEIIINLTVQRAHTSDIGNEFLKYIEDNKISNYSVSIQSYNKQGKKIIGANCKIELKNLFTQDKEYVLNWINVPCSKTSNSTKNDPTKPYVCTCYFSGLQVTNIYRDNMADEVRYVLPSLLTIFKVVALQYDGIQFIAPLRQLPERNYFIRGNVDSVGISGEDTPYLLAKLKGESLKTDMLGEWKGDFPKYFPVAKLTYDELINQWTRHFDLGDLEILGNGANVSISMSGHNIADVGFGVSQILPIITQGIIMQKQQTLLIEQPEIHLHPQMQMDMADFLIQLAKTDRNVIVETHSDHIINRLVKRIMETKGQKNDISDYVKIYFINEDKEVNKVLIDRIKVSKYRGIINAKENFFTQFSAETESILNLSYKNLEKDEFEYKENEEDL